MTGHTNVPAHLVKIMEQLEAVPCTRGDGWHCRTHYDTDLCPACAVALEIDRLHRDLTGAWIA